MHRPNLFAVGQPATTQVSRDALNPAGLQRFDLTFAQMASQVGSAETPGNTFFRATLPEQGPNDSLVQSSIRMQHEQPNAFRIETGTTVFAPNPDFLNNNGDAFTRQDVFSRGLLVTTENGRATGFSSWPKPENTTPQDINQTIDIINAVATGGQLPHGATGFHVGGINSLG
jgi:hypothetical protein